MPSLALRPMADVCGPGGCAGGARHIALADGRVFSVGYDRTLRVMRFPAADGPLELEVDVCCEEAGTITSVAVDVGRHMAITASRTNAINRWYVRRV